MVMVFDLLVSTEVYTLGHDFMPPGIHAGGLRYHGESPLVSQLYNAGQIEAKSYKQAIKEKYKFFSYGDAMLIL